MFDPSIHRHPDPADRPYMWAVRGVAAAAIFVAMSGPVAAADVCVQWKVDGHLVLKQSNNENPTGFTLQQSGQRFSGQGNYNYVHEDAALPGITRNSYRASAGVVGGTVSGNNFEATVRWNNNSVGIYKGQITSEGLLSGHTYDQTDPAAQAEFFATEPLSAW